MRSNIIKPLGLIWPVRKFHGLSVAGCCCEEYGAGCCSIFGLPFTVDESQIPLTIALPANDYSGLGCSGEFGEELYNADYVGCTTNGWDACQWVWQSNMDVSGLAVGPRYARVWATVTIGGGYPPTVQYSIGAGIGGDGIGIGQGVTTFNPGAGDTFSIRDAISTYAAPGDLGMYPVYSSGRQSGNGLSWALNLIWAAGRLGGHYFGTPTCCASSLPLWMDYEIYYFSSGSTSYGTMDLQCWGPLDTGPYCPCDAYRTVYAYEWAYPICSGPCSTRDCWGSFACGDDPVGTVIPVYGGIGGIPPQHIADLTVTDAYYAIPAA